MAVLSNWYELRDTTSVISPSLLVYPDRILHNIKKMIEMAGGTEYLRPHIKTHKTAEIVGMQLEQGITKFKCATIAEAELLAMCGAPDILLAMQPVGADIARFFELMEKYPDSQFSALVDNSDTLRVFSEMVESRSKISVSDEDFEESTEKSASVTTSGKAVPLWMDINTGMDRTGITPDEGAMNLYRQMDADPNIEAKGLHAYDGHIRNTDVAKRKKICDKAFAAVTGLKDRLEAEGISVADIVAGGSPTFPFHATRDGVDASPGTTLLWDAGYGGLFPDMEFLPAAVLLTRVISKPSKNVICLDLGHKHLASEMPFPRVEFLGVENDRSQNDQATVNNGRALEDPVQGKVQNEPDRASSEQESRTRKQKIKNIVQKGQSEEHFVLEVENSSDYRVGDVFYAVPVHICPTVAKYDSLLVVSGGQIIDEWNVAARNQRIHI